MKRLNTSRNSSNVRSRRRRRASSLSVCSPAWSLVRNQACSCSTSRASIRAKNELEQVHPLEHASSKSSADAGLLSGRRRSSRKVVSRYSFSWPLCRACRTSRTALRGMSQRDDVRPRLVVVPRPARPGTCDFLVPDRFLTVPVVPAFLIASRAFGMSRWGTTRTCCFLSLALSLCAAWRSLTVLPLISTSIARPPVAASSRRPPLIATSVFPDEPAAFAAASL